MKRDDGLVIDILVKLQSEEERTGLRDDEFVFDTHSPDVVRWHLNMLIQKGMLLSETRMAGEYRHGEFNEETIISLGWDAFEYLASKRNLVALRNVSRSAST